MKIAIVAPVIRRISNDTLYGGIERIIVSLAIGYADAGHSVVLYAPYGTDIVDENIEIRFTTEQDVVTMPELVAQAEYNLFQRLLAEQDEFDLIHTHIEPIVAKAEDGNYYGRIAKPVLITMHNQTHLPENIEYYESHPEVHKLHFVFISHDQASPLPFLPHQTVIYNGINIDHLVFNATPNLGQLAFLGRITAEKGITEAIAIAKRANKKLIIAGAIDATETDYYEQEIKPQIDGQNVVYLGEVDNETKNTLLRTSEALVFPVQWHEPFGLVVVEAMATGTPVIVSGIGSMREIVEDDKTGFIVPEMGDIEAYAEKITRLSEISRSYCRQVVEEKFTEDTMVANYLKLIDTIV